MTILSPRTATAGLKVPAASQPLPRGAITGVSDTRCHGPNGSRGLPCAAKNVNNAGRANIRAQRERINCNAPVDTGIEKNKKRQGPPPPPFCDLAFCQNYFLFTAFLSSAPGLNFATLRAAILIVAPVCGLRPFRAFLCDTEKVPKPIKATRSPFRSAPVMLLTAVSIAVVACALLISQAPAILSTRSALFISFSSQVSLLCIPSWHREDKSLWLSWET